VVLTGLFEGGVEGKGFELILADILPLVKIEF